MEILQRLFYGSHVKYKEEEEVLKFCKRIWEFLGSRNDIYPSDCDALYFDFSVLPRKVQEEMRRDAYLIFGITDQGEFVSQWIDRWELDKCDG